jgi:hypothetical protein
MPRKEFDSFTRLDASDVNTFLMDQTVQTFADSTARASAITTPVEGMVTYLNDIDSLSVYNGTAFTTDRTIQVFAGTAARGSAIGTAIQGMYTHINDTDSLEFYDGSAWVAAGGGAASALTLIKTQTIGSAVTSVVVADAFSVDYDNYLITLNGGSGSTANTLRMILGSTTTGYHSVNTLYVYNNGSNFVQANNNGASFTTVGAMSSGGLQMELTLQNPFLSRLTVMRSTTIETLSTGAVYFTAGVLNDTTSYTGFTITPNSGNITGGTIRVYGYANA